MSPADSSSTRAPADPAGAVPAHLSARLRALRDALLTGLVERDVAVRLALIATLAGEHLLLIGPPGTAKSLIARRLNLALEGSTYFERLLTRFSVPEELFGPLSIKGLEQDRYERLTRSYLPSASIAFLDEIFKANSAILNSLLTLLNEREFDNGLERVGTPLVAVVGASNELPENEELDALYDRFLLRLHVGPVSKDGFRELLKLRGESEPRVLPEMMLTADGLEAVRQAALAVEVPADVEELLHQARLWCTAQEIPVSDRRWRKVVKLLQVSALTNARAAVSIWDCWLLQHCLWDLPDDREKVYDWYAERVGVSESMDPSRLTRMVVVWEGQLKEDQESRSQMRDGQGRLLYLLPDGKATPSNTARGQAQRDSKPLYLAPQNARERVGRYWEDIDDRTNDGDGYTLDELHKLQVYDGSWGGQREFRAWQDREAYLAEPSNQLIVDIDLKPKMIPTPQKPAHVEHCLASVAELQKDVDEYQRLLNAHIESLEKDIRSHLWVTDDFIEPASASLGETNRTVGALLQRLSKLKTGFENLPQERTVSTSSTAEKADAKAAKPKSTSRKARKPSRSQRSARKR